VKNDRVRAPYSQTIFRLRIAAVSRFVNILSGERGDLRQSPDSEDWLGLGEDRRCLQSGRTPPL